MGLRPGRWVGGTLLRSVPWKVTALCSLLPTCDWDLALVSQACCEGQMHSGVRPGDSHAGSARSPSRSVRATRILAMGFWAASPEAPPLLSFAVIHAAIF